MTGAQLDRAAVAARYGIQPQTVTIEVRRGSLPKPDGYIGRSPWWWSTTLDGWVRPGRTGRPPNDDTTTQRQVPAGRARPGRETVQGTKQEHPFKPGALQPLRCGTCGVTKGRHPK